MARLTIYLLGELDHRVREAAKQSNLSVSKWIAEQISRSVDASWPAEFLALAGAFPDFPDAENLRQGYGDDVQRESAGRTI